MTVGSVGLNRDVFASFDGESAAPAPLTQLVERFHRGEFDLVGIGRVILADPQWLAKIKAGRSNECIPFDAAVAGVVY